MSRSAKGPVPYLRKTRWWVRWADGRGGKVALVLTNSHGQPLLQGVANPTEIYSAAAREYHAWHSAMAGGGAGAGSPVGKSAKAFTVGELTVCYVNAHKWGWTCKTAATYQKPMERFEHFFGIKTPAQSISPQMAATYKVWLSELKRPDGSTLSPRTVQNNLNIACTLMEYAFDMEMISRNPFKRLKRIQATPVREKDPFSPEEANRILTTAREHYPRFYPVVLLVTLTGQRPGAIPFVLVKDYDPRTRTLTLRNEISKQNKGNSYPLPDPLAEVFDRQTAGRNPDERMFLNKASRPLNAKTFDIPDRGSQSTPPGRTWYHLLDRACVRPRGISNLRKALVTNLYHHGVPLNEIVEITGHSERVAREHYLKNCPEKKRQTISKAMALYFSQPPGQLPATPVQATCFEGRTSSLSFSPMDLENAVILCWFGQAFWSWVTMVSVSREYRSSRRFSIPAKRVTISTHVDHVKSDA